MAENKSEKMLFVKPGRTYANGAHFFKIKTPQQAAQIVRSWFTPSAFGQANAVSFADKIAMDDRTGFWKHVANILKYPGRNRKTRRTRGQAAEVQS